MFLCHWKVSESIQDDQELEHGNARVKRSDGAVFGMSAVLLLFGSTLEFAVTASVIVLLIACCSEQQYASAQLNSMAFVNVLVSEIELLTKSRVLAPSVNTEDQEDLQRLCSSYGSQSMMISVATS